MWKWQIRQTVPDTYSGDRERSVTNTRKSGVADNQWWGWTGTESLTSLDICHLTMLVSKVCRCRHVQTLVHEDCMYECTTFALNIYHKLCGSSSPVLTATHHSYGSPRLSDFFPLSALGVQTPQRTITQNGSNDVFSRKDVPFAVKVATFHTPWSPGPLKGENFANFWT